MDGVFRRMATSAVSSNIPDRLSKPKHIKYQLLQSRLESFIGWPRNYVPKTPEELATAGFFYIGSADRVTCFQCGITLRDWEEEHDPVTEHRKYSENCQFINTDLKQPDMPQKAVRDEDDNFQATDEDNTHGEKSTCKICWVKGVSILFLPCGHLVTCSDCAPKVSECVVCQKSIQGTVKTMFVPQVVTCNECPGKMSDCVDCDTHIAGSVLSKEIAPRSIVEAGSSQSERRESDTVSSCTTETSPNNDSGNVVPGEDHEQLQGSLACPVATPPTIHSESTSSGPRSTSRSRGSISEKSLGGTKRLSCSEQEQTKKRLLEQGTCRECRETAQASLFQTSDHQIVSSHSFDVLNCVICQNKTTKS